MTARGAAALPTFRAQRSRPRPPGQYRRQRRLNRLNRTLVLRQLVDGLADELAHFVYATAARGPQPSSGHGSTPHACPSRRLSRRAEQVVGPHPNAIADELDLTGVIVEAGRRQHRATVLARPVHEA